MGLFIPSAVAGIRYVSVCVLVFPFLIRQFINGERKIERMGEKEYVDESGQP